MWMLFSFNSWSHFAQCKYIDNWADSLEILEITSSNTVFFSIHEVDLVDMNLLIYGLVWCRVMLDLERLKGYQKSSLHRLKTFYLKTRYVVPDAISVFQLILIQILSSYSLVAGDRVLLKKVFSSPVFNIQYTPHHLEQRANKNSSRYRIFDLLGHSIIQSLGKK